MDGKQVSKASCEARVENNTTHYVNEGFPQKAKWARVEMQLPGRKTVGQDERWSGATNTKRDVQAGLEPRRV